MKHYAIFTHKSNGEKITYYRESNLKIYDFCEWLIHNRFGDAPPLYGTTSICRIYASGYHSSYYEIYNHSKWLTPYGGAY